MKFWLAQRLGMTVRQLEQTMTAREFEYWMLWVADMAREPINLGA